MGSRHGGTVGSVTFPADTAAYNASGWTAGAPIAGTATDATSGIAGTSAITLTITQNATGDTWNGSSFQSGTHTVNPTTYSSGVWTYTFPNTNFPADGSYSVAVQATDQASNPSSTATNTFKYDTAAPTASFSFPAAGGFYNAAGWDATGAITGTATDNGGAGINQIKVAIQDGSGNYYDGSGFNNASITYLTASGTTSWSYAIAASKLSDGHTYNITVGTIDSATNNNVNLSAATRSFSYDTSAPTASFSFPAAAVFYNAAGWDATGAITGTASDGSGSGVNQVQIAIQDGSGNYYDGSAFSSASILYLTATGTTSWSYAIASGKLTNGHTYNLTVTTVDNTTTANTNLAAATRSFSYDTAAPTASFSFPAAGGFYNAAGWNATGAITGTATDNGGAGINQINVAIQDGSGNYYDGSGFNNASITYLTASGGTTSWSYAIAASKLSDGHTYNVTVETIDSATTNNVNLSAAARSFSYDTTPPTATITFPTASAYSVAGWGSGTLAGTASDSGSGVASVKVSIQKDGGANACWDGTNAAGHFTAACPNYVVVSGTTSWTKTLSAGSLVNGSTYAMTVQTTDNTTTANSNNSVATTSWIYDTAAPTVTINQASAQTDPTNVSPINFTVVFSESVSDFATGDVSLGGTAGATTATVTGSGTTYNVAVSGMTTTGTVIATVGAGVAHDAANNGNTASTSTDNTVTYQNLLTPTAVTITNGTGGTAGKAEQNDVIKITWNRAINLATVCSSWSNGSDTVTGVTVRMNRGNGSATNDLTFLSGTVGASACSGGIKIGAMNMTVTSTEYEPNNSNDLFQNSTVTWNSGTNQLVITLGAPDFQPPNTVATSSYLYTPTATIAASGAPTVTATGTATTGTVRNY